MEENHERKTFIFFRLLDNKPVFVYCVVLCLTFWSFVCWLLISCCAALLIFAFLVSHRGEGLSKTAIGDYLGEKSPFHEQVLKAFVDLHDFTDLIIVQALR
jgi:hypothetical protein